MHSAAEVAFPVLCVLLVSSVASHLSHFCWPTSDSAVLCSSHWYQSHAYSAQRHWVLVLLFAVGSESEMRMRFLTKDWLDCWSVQFAWSTWVHQYTSAAEDILCALHVNPSYQAAQHVALVLQSLETLPWKRLMHCVQSLVNNRIVTDNMSIIGLVCEVSVLTKLCDITRTIHQTKEDIVLHNVGSDSVIK